MVDILQIAVSNAVLVTAAAPVVWGLARAIKQPALTHLLWVIVLLKLVTPPLWLISVHLPVSHQSDAMPAKYPQHWVASAPKPRLPAVPDRLEFQPRSVMPREAEAQDLPAIQPSSPPWWRSGKSLLPLLELIWISGSLICFGIASIRMTRFSRMLRHATRAPADAQRRVCQLTQRLNMKQAPTLCFIGGAFCPMLWAVGRTARLLVPIDLWDRLEPAQRDAIVLHELAHWRRRDHWVRWLELLATSLFWWNPTCWWARHELREAEEQCCDAWVLWAMGDFRNYANALLKAVEFVSIRADQSFAPSAAPALASGMGQFGHLKRRITMLKDGQVSRALSRSGTAVAITLGAMLLPASAGLGQEAPATQQPQNSPLPESAAAPQQNFSPDRPSAVDSVAMEHQLRDAKRQIDEFKRRLQEAEARLAVLQANGDGRPSQPGVATNAPVGARVLVVPSGNGAGYGTGTIALVRTPVDATIGTASVAGVAGTITPDKNGGWVETDPLGAERESKQAARLDRIERQLRDMLREVQDIRTETGNDVHPQK